MLTGILLLFLEELDDLFTNLTVRDLNIVFGLAIVGHQREEAIIRNIKLYEMNVLALSVQKMPSILPIRRTYKLIFLASNIRHIHVVGGRAKIFQLLASENVNCDQVNLCVAVLAGLRGTHFDNLAGATLDDDETVLAERRALHRIGG